MKKGQSAVEFVVLVSFMIAVFFVFFFVIQARIVDITREQDQLYLEEANNIIMSEVELAFTAAPDFEHTFIVPNAGENIFEINITNYGEVVSRFDTLTQVNFFVINVTGHLHGLNQNNTVYSVDGIITFPNQTEISLPRYSGVYMNVNPETCYIANELGSCNDPLVLPAQMLPLCQMHLSLC